MLFALNITPLYIVGASWYCTTICTGMQLSIATESHHVLYMYTVHVTYNTLKERRFKNCIIHVHCSIYREEKNCLN